MKTNLLLLLAMLLPLGEQARSDTPPQATTGRGTPVDDAPSPNHLSPDAQAWVGTINNRPDAAVAQKDINAIGQWTPDETRRLMAGMTACGHVVDDGTFVDAVSFNASAQQAIAIRWLDPRGTVVHSAVFADSGRCVAKDGDVLDGKPIQRVLPNSLAVSNQHGLIAWEAEYWNSPLEHAAGSSPHRGVFIENRFLAELDPRKASVPGSREASNRPPDFHWNEAQETVAVRPDILLAPANPSTAQAKPTSPPCPAPVKPGFLDKLKQRAAKALDKQAANADAQIGKATKGNVDAGVQDATSSAVNDAAPDPCNPQKGQGKKQ